MTGYKDINKLIQELKNENSLIRSRAAIALGETKDSGAVEPLIAALGEKNGDVQMWAARALGEIGDPRAIEPLMVLLKEPSNTPPHVTAEALAKLGIPAVEPLIDMLKEDNRDRMWAAIALGEIKDRRAVKPLTALLKDKDEEVRVEAARAICNIEGLATDKSLIVDAYRIKSINDIYGVLEDAKGSLGKNLNDGIVRLEKNVHKANKQSGLHQRLDRKPWWKFWR